MQSTAHKLWQRQRRRRHLLSLSDLVNFCTFKTWHEPFGAAIAVQNQPPCPLPAQHLTTAHVCVSSECVCVCVCMSLCVCVWNNHTFNLARQFPALTAVSLSLSHSLLLFLFLPLTLFLSLPLPASISPFILLVLLA